jgi:hypothetical protein
MIAEMPPKLPKSSSNPQVSESKKSPAADPLGEVGHGRERGRSESRRDQRTGEHHESHVFLLLFLFGMIVHGLNILNLHRERAGARKTWLWIVKVDHDTSTVNRLHSRRPLEIGDL